MRIDVRDQQRQYLFAADVDESNPPSVVRPAGRVEGKSGGKSGGQRDDASTTIYLNWDQALDDEQHLRRCPVCGCRELFARKDFPQVTGFVIVVLAVVVSMLLFGMRLVQWGIAVLGIVALIDLAIYFFVGKCLVCYRCRSEFRRVKMRHNHPGWDLATGEKYRINE